MTRVERIELELSLYEIIEREDIRRGEELTSFMQDLHDLLESVAYEYAHDNDLEDDYEPSY